MTDTLYVLAQISPAANTVTAAYTVPALKSTVLSSIFVCNTNVTAQTFCISIAIAGAVDAPVQYIYYNLPILGNDTFVLTTGITLATTDVINIKANATLINFTIFGDEVS